MTTEEKRRAWRRARRATGKYLGQVGFSGAVRHLGIRFHSPETTDGPKPVQVRAYCPVTGESAYGSGTTLQEARTDAVWQFIFQQELTSEGWYDETESASS